VTGCEKDELMCHPSAHYLHGMDFDLFRYRGEIPNYESWRYGSK
jgi:hypothetical protein